MTTPAPLSTYPHAEESPFATDYLYLIQHAPPPERARSTPPPHASVHSHETNPEKKTQTQETPTKWEQAWMDAAAHEHEHGRPYDMDVIPASRAETEFRHSGWARTRAKIDTALASTDCPTKRLMRFRNCGSHACLYRSDGGKIKIGANYCHDRWCQPCGRTRGVVIAGNLAAAMIGRRWRMLTLTLKHSEQTLLQTVDRLNACWNRLRERKYWKALVKGGASFIEVKRNLTTKGWHVHMHVIVEGEWMYQGTLAAEWLAVTGDSHIIDLRRPPNNVQVARYVAKYASKPLDHSLLQDEDSLQQLVTALKGRRLCATFGTWRKIQLEDRGTATETGWTRICTLDEAIAAERQGERWARDLLNQFRPTNQQEKGSDDEKCDNPPGSGE